MFLTEYCSFVNTIGPRNEFCVKTPRETIELEIKVLLDSRINKPVFLSNIPKRPDIKQLKELKNIKQITKLSSETTSQTINFINTDKVNKRTYIKQLIFENGIQLKDGKNYYSKTLIAPHIFLENSLIYKMCLNSECIENNKAQQDKYYNTFDLVRFRSRYSFVINEPHLQDWKIEISIIKETKDQSLSNLKQIRDALFLKNTTGENFIDSIDFEYSDRIELELEYIGDIKNFNKDCIKYADIIIKKYILHLDDGPQSSILSSPIKKSCEECIKLVASYLKPHMVKSDKYKTAITLKQILSNPIELNKSILYNNVISEIENFIVTEKIDGTRTLIIISISEKLCYVINNNTIKSDNYDIPIEIPADIIKEISISDGSSIKATTINSSQLADIKDIIILDSEAYDFLSKDALEETKMETKMETKYYIFDIIYYKGASHSLSFKDRLALLDTIMPYISSITYNNKPFIYRKHFMPLNKDTYLNDMTAFYEDMLTKEYNIDGLILVSLHKDYNTTINYKWKPITTIDFIAKKCPLNMLGINPYVIKENLTLYLLFSGFNSQVYNKLGVEKIKLFKDLFKLNTHKNGQYTDSYIPVCFSPSSNPYAFLFWSVEKELDNKIVELKYDIQENNWILCKIREDRNVDLLNKSYYGNNFMIAETIWMTYKSPILLKDFKSNNSYFKISSETQIGLRKFNNFVKKEILDSCVSNSGADSMQWVIDLGAGRGQDLDKYISCKFKNIMMIDSDYDALIEIINRKYKYVNNRNIDHLSKIYIKQINLSSSHKTIISTLEESNFNITRNCGNYVVCNFALHYLIPNKKQINNFSKLLNMLLIKSGIFIFTAFNGSKVFKLLADNNGIYNTYKDDKLCFSIKKKYTEDHFTGNNQIIEVLLPFSNNEYYEEWLINDELLISTLAKTKIKLIKTNSFDAFHDIFRSIKPHFYNQMDEIDRHYASLYSFYIFTKI